MIFLIKGKYMEISKDRSAYYKTLLCLFKLTLNTLVNVWKFPKTGLDTIKLYSVYLN